MHTVTLHFTASDKGNNFLAAVADVIADDEPSMCTRSKIKDRVICTYLVEAPGTFEAVHAVAAGFRESVQRDEFRLVYVRSNGVTTMLRDGGPAPVQAPRMGSDPADRRASRPAAVGRRTSVVEAVPVEDGRTVEERIASAMDEARELVGEALRRLRRLGLRPEPLTVGRESAIKRRSTSNCGPYREVTNMAHNTLKSEDQRPAGPSYKLVVVINGVGTVATADQVQSFLVDQGYDHPKRLATMEDDRIFAAGVAIEGSERRILSEIPRWDGESGDLVAAVTEVVGHDDWQAIVALMPGDAGPSEAEDPHTGQYL